MSSESGPGPRGGTGRRLGQTAQVIVIGSVMFTFISYWRTAAVVLCDLASTAYYIGGIVEQAIGKAAPWFILAVMLFSYAVRSVYIESCSLFVRGGVYRVVREAIGPFTAKLAVSALMFDYILTGPTSGVSAGQYIMGMVLETLHHFHYEIITPEAAGYIKDFGAVVIACIITLYFFRQNLLGIHESSGKALKIMIATTVMGVIILTWSIITLAVKPVNPLPSLTPDLEKKTEWNEGTKTSEPKINKITNEQEDPLGFLGRYTPSLAEDIRTEVRKPGSWLQLLGLIGLFIAFGHSVLAMSGEETLAQVYREVESPKLPNFKKAAFIVFVYSLFFTVGISFLAVLLIPEAERMPKYSDNLIGGLAMNVLGPIEVRLLLNAFVVIVGFLILAGAVNTSIIGSNGVLNRVAEDGVMPDWFLKPHWRYGTTYRVLYLIVGLQLVTILASRGDVYLLGEAYAFGVVWSFVFNSLSMLVLRFKNPTPREFRVPLNIRVGRVELPVGLFLIFLILLITATLNFLTKEVATIGGVIFTGAFLATFTLSEYYHEKKRRGEKHQHLEQFSEQLTQEITPASLGLNKNYRKLVAIRSPQNLFMLEKALDETDPETTGVVVMTAKMILPGEGQPVSREIDPNDQKLMTAVVQRAEKAGKQVKPLIVPTNSPLFAIINTARQLQAQELIVGASNIYTADEQLEQLAFYWINAHGGNPAPLTIRILGRDRDVYLDLGGGNRIPKISERKARTVAELRAAGVGVDRVLLVHDGTQANSDLFQAVLTMLDPLVALAIVPAIPPGSDPYNGPSVIQQDQQRARQLDREMQVCQVNGELAAEILRLAQEGRYDLIILSIPAELPQGMTSPLDIPLIDTVVRNAHCRVFLASPPNIPREPEQEPAPGVP